MDARIEALDSVAAVQALRNVAQRWIEHRGLEAFCVIDSIRRTYRTQYEQPPGWLLSNQGSPPDELVSVSKMALDAILDGEDSDSSGWVEVELADLSVARAHVLDPISLAIVGASLIGIILASRVKRLGNIEFYEGLPPETVELVKHALTVDVPRQT
jgi:hypothetical protein